MMNLQELKNFNEDQSLVTTEEMNLVEGGCIICGFAFSVGFAYGVGYEIGTWIGEQF